MKQFDVKVNERFALKELGVRLSRGNIGPKPLQIGLILDADRSEFVLIGALIALRPMTIDGA